MKSGHGGRNYAAADRPCGKAVFQWARRVPAFKKKRHPEVAFFVLTRSVAYSLSSADFSPANGLSLRNFDG